MNSANSEKQRKHRSRHLMLMGAEPYLHSLCHEQVALMRLLAPDVHFQVTLKAQ